ncbi:uncharacterized protein [Dysidea avara]|uniref:uncharacterized protein n=1 Tax=Dysidea avara TaxID=196820 RepID=UPI0033320AD3
MFGGRRVQWVSAAWQKVKNSFLTTRTLYNHPLARRAMEVLLKSLYFCLRYILWVLALLFGLGATNTGEQQDGQAKEVEPPDKHQSIVCESLKPAPPKVATSFSNNNSPAAIATVGPSINEVVVEMETSNTSSHHYQGYYIKQ